MIKINFDSPYKIDDGYGNAGENILLALDNHPNIAVHTSNNWKHTTYKFLLDRTTELCTRGFNRSSDFSIRFSQPDSFSLAPECKKAKIGWSMWEFANLPKKWISGINSVPINFVPCEHNRKLWIESGANIPVFVVHFGVDPDYFYYIPDNAFAVWEGKKNLDLFTFIIAGTLSARKNPNMVLKVFNELFRNKDKVRLIIKTSSGLPFSSSDISDNVIVINETWRRTHYADLLRSGDVFVYPTQGEGFGLSPLEAMAVGCTTICTNWSGPEDYLDETFSYNLNYTLTGKVGSHSGETFIHAVPDENHLKELMWHCYNHQDEVREKGKLAAKWVNNNLTWQHTAQRVYDILKNL